MKPLTIKELAVECAKQIGKGNGDKVIMISDDDEGNGYHYLWYSFTTVKDYENEVKEYGGTFYWASDDVTSKDNTVILG